MAKTPKQQTVVQVKASTVKTEAHRQQRLTKHLKKHPNDKQTELAKGKPKTPRSKPKVKNNFAKPRTKVRNKAGHVTGVIDIKPFTKE